MKIVCGSCAAKYTVSDEKVQGKSVKVKCRKCGAVIIVAPGGEVRTEGGNAAPAVTYTVSVSETDQRSMGISEIVAAYNDGTIDADTFVWTEGMDEWSALKDVDVIVDALHSAAQADAGQHQAPHNGGVGSLDSTMAMSEGAGMASYDAALAAQRAAADPAKASPFGGGVQSSAAAVDYGTSGGLFGAAAASSPGASLFGGGGGASMFSNVSTGATGAPSAKPDENSAIFSLNTLTAKASSGPARRASNNEDSGLIDLKALASSVSTGTEIGIAASASPYGDGGLFSIPAPPPPAVTVVAGPMGPPQQVVEVAKPANKGLIIGLGILVVALIGAVVFLALQKTEPVAKRGDSSSEDVPRPEASNSSEAPKPSTSASAATATQIASAESSANAPSAESSAEAPAADSSASATASSAAPPPKRGGPTPPPKSNGAAPPPPPKSNGAAPPPPPPKTSTGGCRPDDLMCLMRAGAKKKK